MSKKNQTTEEVNQSQEAEMPVYVDELLKTGTTILAAHSRDELSEMVNNLPASVHYAVGAVGRNPETGAFVLRVDITQN